MKLAEQGETESKDVACRITKKPTAKRMKAAQLLQNDNKPKFLVRELGGVTNAPIMGTKLIGYTLATKEL